MRMNKMKIYPLLIVILMSFFTACEDFMNPEQELVLHEANIPADEVELRSASLGLYAIQQELVDQMIVLGELRGDLLKVTKNADTDLREVYNFQISPTNRYANPTNFYKLIAASNKILRILENKYPELTNPESDLSNPHRMYGEAICMKSWAYFNAARIFNEIPYIPESLTDISEIDEYVNSSGTYVDSTFIDYHPNGFDNGDTVVKVYEYTEKRFMNQDAIIKRVIKEIEDRVRVVGVDYSLNKDNSREDITWEVTIWNEYAKHCLLGQMYLHLGDYTQAMKNFNVILTGTPNLRYGLDNSASYDNWKRILTDIDLNEHIFTLWFGKSDLSFQQNNLQYYFSAKSPNIHAIQPTRKAVELWETAWRFKDISIDISDPDQTRTISPGVPGDYYRGAGVSYAYIKNGEIMDNSSMEYMLDLKLRDNQNELIEYMEGVDTVVYKYTIGKDPFAHDANFMIYRAAGIHLYAAEIYANWVYMAGGLPRQYLTRAENYIYNGNYQGNDNQLGVAGRVGLGDIRGISVDNDVIYEFHPYNNEVIGYQRISTTLEKQLYLEEVILKERARELAFEGERFYDIVRVARRRNKLGEDGSAFLANTIAEKFPASEREYMRAYLQNSENWYLPFVLR